jgi:ParB family chromosome partitioning protein
VRDIDTAAVSSLAESMELVGQLSPILLTTDREVIFGRQRVAAQRARGASTIRAVIVDLSEILARVATLDETLCRPELTILQRAELLAERKALYEQLHPDARHGAAGDGDAAAVGFTRAMAQLTGRGRSTIAEDCQIGQLPESIRQLIRGTALERRKADLLELARLPTEVEQLVACHVLLDGTETGASKADVPAGGRRSRKKPNRGANVEEDAAKANRDCETSVLAGNLVERALKPLQDWLDEHDASPAIENRYVAMALALVNSAVSLLDRTASGIEGVCASSAFAKRARRAAGALAGQAERTRNELVLITECICADGCPACGFVHGFAAVDAQRRIGKTRSRARSGIRISSSRQNASGTVAPRRPRARKKGSVSRSLGQKQKRALKGAT